MSEEKKPTKLDPKLAALIAEEQAASPFRRTLSKGGSKVGVRPEPAPAPAEKAGARDAGRAGGGAQDRPIEEVVLSMPGMEGVDGSPEPRLFIEFVEKILPRIVLPATSHAILVAFSNIDVTAEKIAATLMANPYMEHLFLAIVESYKKRETAGSLESALILLGMQNSRNLIVAMQCLRLVHGTHPVKTREGRIDIQPARVLRYALRSEDALAHRRNTYSDTAYGAGLLFDILALIAEAEIADAKQKRRVLGFIDSVYAHGTLTARLSVEIAKTLPDFSYMKYVYSAGLVHDIGKVALAILRPEYVDYLELCSRQGLSRALRHHGEQRLFGLTHAQLGAVCCHHYRLLRSVELPVQFHHEPYLLKGYGRGAHQLAWALGLASNIAGSLRAVEKPDDPILSVWRGPELQDIPMDFEAIQTVVRAVS